jgi:hypothetical protein
MELTVDVPHLFSPQGLDVVSFNIDKANGYVSTTGVRLPERMGIFHFATTSRFVWCCRVQRREKGEGRTELHTSIYSRCLERVL